MISTGDLDMPMYEVTELRKQGTEVILGLRTSKDRRVKPLRVIYEPSDMKLVPVRTAAGEPLPADVQRMGTLLHCA